MIPKLPRYSAIDVYTLEELRREYQSSTARGRIRLLSIAEETIVVGVTG